MVKTFIKQLLLAMLLVCSATTYAQQLSTVSASFDAGKSRLFINISSPEFPFTAMQFKAYFEGGVSIKQSNGKYSINRGDRITKYYDEDTEETTYSHTIESAAQNDGSIMVVIYSGTNTLFTGTEGSIVGLNLTAAGVSDGAYAVSLKDVIIANPASEKQVLADYSAYLVVEGGVITSITDEAPEVKPDYSAEIAELRALVASAQSTHDAAVEGSANGEYPAGAKAALQAVITEVNAAITDEIDLETIEALTAQINAAVTEFEGKVITNAAKADNTLAIQDVVAVNKQVDLSIEMNNLAEITTIQLDLVLPAGVVIAKDEDDIELISLGRTTEKKHNVAINMVSEGVYRILCKSDRLEPFAGNEGEIMNITLNISDDVEIADYIMEIRDIVLSTPEKVKYTQDLATATLFVKALLGDADDDGVVDGNDVTVTIAYILEVISDDEINLRNANADGDEVIDANDVTAIIYTILNPEAASLKTSAPKRISAYAAEDECSLYIEDFELTAGEEVEVEILMTNPGRLITTVQFDIVLPEGIELIPNEDDELVALGSRTTYKKHSISAEFVGTGVVRALASSSSLKTFKGEEGDAFTFLVKGADDLKDGVYEISIKEALLSEVDSEGKPVGKILLTDTTAKVSVGDTTGIDGIEADGAASDEAIYDLTGRKVINMVKGGIYIKGGKKFIAQ